MPGWALTRMRNISLVLHCSRQESSRVVVCGQSRELFSNIRGRGAPSNACFHLLMSPSHRQAVNFLKCAFILVQSKLSIPRVGLGFG